MIKLRLHRVYDLIEQVRQMEDDRRQTRRIDRIKEMDRQSALCAQIGPIAADYGLSAKVSAFDSGWARMIADDASYCPIEYWVDVTRCRKESHGGWFAGDRTITERVFIVRALEDDSIQMTYSTWYSSIRTIPADVAISTLEMALAKAIAGVKLP